ncbi:MAG: hypothetical protein ACD_75C02125G0002 [uncultured bacterium]|nr:MAG: hypothetical protein ACD_75C02125G0002 [uncultured bacterium]
MGMGPANIRARSWGVIGINTCHSSLLVSISSSSGWRILLRKPTMFSVNHCHWASFGCVTLALVFG